MPAPARSPGSFDASIPTPRTLLKRPVTRLPWLDGIGSSRNLPGGFDSELVDLAPPTKPPAASGNTRTKSLSEPPAANETEPRTSAQSLPSADSSFVHAPTGTYTPSMYSTRAQLIDHDHEKLNSLALKDWASYEKLVARPFVVGSKASLPKLQVPPRTSSLAVLSTSKDGDRRSDDVSLTDITRKVSAGDANFSSDAASQHDKSRAKARRAASDAAITVGSVKGNSHYPRSKSMQLAVNDLQKLMQESLQLAESATNQGRMEDATKVLEEATVALRKASRVESLARPPMPTPDLERLASSEDYTADSSSDIESDSSFDLSHKRRSSKDTMPTEYSRSLESPSSTKLPPGKIALNTDSKSMTPAARAALADGDISPGTVSEKDNSKSVGLGLPPGLQRSSKPASQSSIVVDFAYVDRPTQALSKNSPYRRISTSGPRRVHRPAKRPTIVQEEFDLNPEEVDQAPILVRSSEEPLPKHMRMVEPIPIVESVETGSYGPNKRKPRQRGRLASTAPGRPGPASAPGVILIEGTTLPAAAAAGASSGPNMVEADVPSGFVTVELDVSPERKQLKYRRRPVAREWKLMRKRLTAIIACINTSLVGIIAGIYAGEVPKIQYQLADTDHRVILGNVVFFIGLGITTLLAWPLPLLHGRKPYILIAIAVTLPLQFPQAISVSQFRSPDRKWYIALLLPRAFSGLALGFANVNFLATLLDLFGASLQSRHPHQEVVDSEDIRRQGGGIGL
ncbi:hypothetical protein MRB53_041452 [Persea americana]|nr:hypothetical protein MRB53_041452 [Persea americana]